MRPLRANSPPQRNKKHQSRSKATLTNIMQTPPASIVSNRFPCFRLRIPPRWSSSVNIKVQVKAICSTTQTQVDYQRMCTFNRTLHPQARQKKTTQRVLHLRTHRLSE